MAKVKKNADKEKNKKNEDNEMEKIYNKWTGKSGETPEQPDAGIGDAGVGEGAGEVPPTGEVPPIGEVPPTEEGAEPYVDIEPIEVDVALPFDVAENDEIDMSATVTGVDENGNAKISITKALKK